MNKISQTQKFSRIVCTCLGFLVLFNTSYASTFSDVPSDHTYSTSISFLESYGIVEGYEDGTYKPESLINRAEFLKIALEAVEVELNTTTPTGFTDVDKQAWYAPYLQKAYKEGWIQGYPDGSFKPYQNINKVEAFKLLGEIQEWDRLTLPEVPETAFADTYRFIWYSPYVHFAKENDLLFEETTHLYPDTYINRGYMAELVYRTITKDIITYDPTKTAEDIITQQTAVETPSTFKMIDKLYFRNIKLANNIPNVMYKNELYIIEGTFDDSINVEDTFAFLSKENDTKKEYSNFFGTVNGSSFSIPIVFREAGTFNLGIVPGLSGESKVASITVLDGIPPHGSTTLKEKPNTINIAFKNDETRVSWNSQELDIFRVYFIQDDTIHSYFVRDKKTLRAFFEDFTFFEEGEVKIRIYGAQADTIYPVSLTSAWHQSSDKSFRATKHHFKLSYNESITYSTLPETLPNIQKLYVSGTTYEPIRARGAVITPSGTIDTFPLTTDGEVISYYGTDVIQSGSTFSFVYQPSQEGTYLLEINDTGGSALVNVPIYIGNYIPLIPDFFDLQDPLEKTQTLNLQEAREEMLQYINSERQKQGLKVVKLLPQLNTLAQNHTDDMVENEFFAHVNLQGETPDDRRINLSIYTDVGENLAHAPTVYFAHEALMRSAIHRKNILTSYWDTVGLGITKDENGYLVVAEEFSHNPWTQEDLQEFEYYLLDNINEIRTSPLQMTSELDEIADDWSKQMITQDFFSFISPTGENLIDVVQNSGVSNEGRAYILKEGSIESLFKQLIKESSVTEDEWARIGLGLTQDVWSTLHLTVIFTR